MLMLRDSLFFLVLVSVSGCQSIQGVDLHDTETIKQTQGNTIQLPVDSRSGKQPLGLLAELSTVVGLKFSQVNESHAQRVLESNFTRQTSEWIDELNTVVVSVVPTHTFMKNGLHCRKYRAMIRPVKREVTMNATACRQSDGVWIVQ